MNHPLIKPIHVLFALVAGILLGIAREARAQTVTPFLISPYFGTTNISQTYHAGHRAYDYGLRYVHVLAADAGTVRSVRWYSDDPGCHQVGADPNGVCGYGLHIRMQHSNGYWTIYAHLSATAFDLGTTGTTVGQGQIIGTSGHTGFSTGPHLHFEVRPSEFGAGVDPSDTNAFLWKDGQWANPSRPIPAPSGVGETVVYEATGNLTRGFGGLFNNQCPINTACGAWINSGGSPYLLFYTPVFGNTADDEWARWRLQGVDARGQFYDVFIHSATTTITPRTWQARYRVVNGSGTTLGTGRVDQEGLPNATFPQSEWVSIGLYYLTNNSYVYTTDVTGEAFGGHCPGTYCRLLVDAVKFVHRPTSRLYLPLIQKD